MFLWSCKEGFVFCFYCKHCGQGLLAAVLAWTHVLHRKFSFVSQTAFRLSELKKSIKLQRQRIVVNCENYKMLSSSVLPLNTAPEFYLYTGSSPAPQPWTKNSPSTKVKVRITWQINPAFCVLPFVEIPRASNPEMWRETGQTDGVVCFPSASYKSSKLNLEVWLWHS